MQTHDAVEFCQAVMAGAAARRSEEGRGRGSIGGPAVSRGRPASPHVRRTPWAAPDGLLAPVAERDTVEPHLAAAPSPFERQSRVSWDR